MALTSSQIRDRAATELGILALDQALQSQDASRITQAYNEVYAQLKQNGLATWASDGSVPDELCPHVIALVAFNCLDTYSVSNDRYTRITNEAAVARREIRSLIQPNNQWSQEDPKDY